MSRRIKRILIVLAAVCAVSAAVLFLIYKEIIKLNTPSREEYPVRGVDVSSYQGEIDWGTLSQGLDFAYIKATEGAKYADDRFEYNWREARRTALRIGAYHFFSFDSAGTKQAENFLSRLEGFEGMLPPVIDVELYGKYRSTPKPAAEVIPELKAMADAVEERCGMKPLFYATGKAYRLYIKDGLPESRVWIRNVYTRPSEDIPWDFWQYSGRGELSGYSGEERYIDLNVFNGSKEEFARFFGADAPNRQ